MKRIYLILLLSFLWIGAYAALTRNDFVDVSSQLQIDTNSLINKVQTSQGSKKELLMPMQSYSHTKLESGKIVYGFCAFDGSWSEEIGSQYGLYSFNSANTEVIQKIWGTDQAIDACAYYDGYYYVQTSTIDGGTYTSMSFGRFEANTGEYEYIADWTASKPRFTDFTVDYSAEPPQLIGLQYGLSPTQRRLTKINMSSGALSTISNGNTNGTFVAIACSYDGVVFVINSSGRLQKINRTTGSVSNVGTLSTGITPKFLQSMEFDHTDGKLYWAAYSSNNEGKFGTINTTNGGFTNLGTLGNNAEFTGIYVPFIIGEPGTPLKISNLTITPAANGVKSATLSWTNPSKDNTGSMLTSGFSIKIYRNGEIVHTIENQTSGIECTYIDNVISSGIYNYKVTVENEFGESLPSLYQLFVGEDVPKGPTNVVLTKDGENGILNWIAPTVGGSNGWINTAQLTYTITRNPSAIVVAENVSGTTYTDSSITEYGHYSYVLQAKTNMGDGGIATSNAINMGAPLSLPYNCTFNADQFATWTIIDANDDWSTWIGNGFAQYSSYGMDDADDWLISPPIKMLPGKYRLSFDCNAMNSSVQKFKVKYGKDKTIEAQTNELADYNNIANTISLRKTIVVEIIESDVYNFSFYIYSNADFGGGLTIDNIELIKMGDNDLQAISISGNSLPMVGKNYFYNVTVYNAGTITQNDYEVQIIGENGEILASTNVVPEITMNNTKVVAVNWTPENEGITQIRGKVVLNKDDMESNNISSSITVDVQPAGGDEMVLIGDKNEEAVTMPINFYYSSSVSQTIYLKEEIGLENGLIKKIIYPYRNGSFRETEFVKNIQIYMANTSRSETTEGWILQEELTKVFDGSVTIVDDGEAQMIINLDDPFVYSGGNLCIMNIRPIDTEFINGIYFYLSTKDENRTRLYSNDYIEFDWTQDGNASKKIPQIIMQIAELGTSKIMGTVKCDGIPVNDSKITISPLGMTTTTNSDGEYIFTDVPPNNYTLTSVKHGYYDAKATGVDVLEYLTTTRDITMTKLSKYEVTGYVKDADGIGIENANINITGYEKYQSITDANGLFRIPEVYLAEDYKLKVTKNGYENSTLTFNVSSNITLQSIILNAVPKPAEKVSATATEQKVDITWNTPSSTTFRYDDGIAIGGLNPVYPPSQFGVMGTVHRNPAVINSMSWWTVGDYFLGAPHEKVNVFVFDLNENGEPTNNILFNKMNVENKDDQWTSFTFPEPLECPRGFMVAIGYLGIMGLGHDSGRDAEWPFVPNGNYSSGNYSSGTFTKLPGDMPYNLMVRAEGFEITDIKNYDTKSLKGYKIWRFAESDLNIENRWIELTPSPITELTYTDNSWASIENGTYKYAVKTIYSGEVMSVAAISNMVAKGMWSTVTINVITNTNPNDSNGAKITLINNDGSVEHVYDGVVDANGKSIIQNVWKGVYSIKIEKEGYTTITETDLQLTTDAVSFNYNLEETIVIPFNLEIVENEYPSERIFNWNIAPSKVLQRYEIYLDNIKKADVMENTYKFTALENGTYIAGIKAVYGSTTTEMVTISFNVTGQVVAASVLGTVLDIESLPIADAEVKVTGKRTYNTTTDNMGLFHFPAIMAGTGYTLTISKSGYGNQVRTFSLVAGVDINMGEITLGETTYVPRKIKASENEENVTLTWVNGADEKSKIFRYDDGTAINGLGSPNGNDKTIVGNVYRTPASLTNMSWVTVGNATKVNVFVFDLTEGGEPTNTVLFSQLNVSNTASSTAMIWNNIIFPVEIDCPRGFFLAISIATPQVGNIALGFDAGTSSTWPFIPNVGYFNGDYTNPAGLQYVGAQFPGNLLIRAEGYDNSSSKTINTNNSKSLTGYNVWRFAETDQTDENKWLLLTENAITESHITDNHWADLESGNYKYAVKAIYTGGVISSPGFSNAISKNNKYILTITQAENGIISVKNGSETINSGDKIYEGMEITISAIPESSKYVLDYITVNDLKIEGNKYKIIGNTNISALFRERDAVDEMQTMLPKLYPNPVKDILNIEGECSSLEIYNMMGKLMMRIDALDFNQNSNVTEINLNSLTSGTYMIKAHSRRGDTSIHKIVKVGGTI